MVRSLIQALGAVTLAAVLTAPALAGGDAAHGAQVFVRCAMCHNANNGGPNGLGPNLFGVAGRPAASLANFNYSSALKNAKIVWTDDNLKKWVMGPQKMVPGTRMTFAGLSSEKDADDVVAFLNTRKSVGLQASR